MKFLSATLLAIAVGISACGEASPPAKPAAQVVQQMPVEQKFISVSQGKQVESSDPSVKRAKELIERAVASYGIDAMKVADQAYMTFKVGRDDGIHATALEVLEAATLAHVPGVKMEFAEYCAMYLTLRKSGMAHADAMMGMKGLISSLKDMSK